jgi:cupin 2 domain-containing protein
MATKKIKSGNIYASLPGAGKAEVFETLLGTKDVKIKRITSLGQATAEDVWLREPKDEWVVLLAGKAKLFFKGAKKLTIMEPGDHVYIPAGTAHRVEWTTPDERSVWLAVHF